MPKDGQTFQVDATGPTFWSGGTDTDPCSLFGQAFVELQFYPDSIVTSCSSNGGFEVKFAANAYTACSPIWTLTSTGHGARLVPAKAVRRGRPDRLVSRGQGADRAGAEPLFEVRPVVQVLVLGRHAGQAGEFEVQLPAIGGHQVHARHVAAILIGPRDHAARRRHLGVTELERETWMRKSLPAGLRHDGGGGIRTHGALARPTIFKTVPFDRSGTPPGSASLGWRVATTPPNSRSVRDPLRPKGDSLARRPGSVDPARFRRRGLMGEPGVPPCLRPLRHPADGNASLEVLTGP